MLLTRREEAEHAWNFFLALSVGEALVALVLHAAHLAGFGGWGVSVDWRLGYAQPQGTLIEPNVLGALAGAAAVALVLRASDRGAGLRARSLAALGAAPLLVAVAASLTRAAWVAVPFALVAVVALSRRSARRLALAAAAVAAAALLALFLAPRSLTALGEARTGLAGKVASFANLSEDVNVAMRLRTYDAALELFRERPLLGAGHGAMERIAAVEDARLAWAGNLEVHLLADTGLAGAAALLLFLALALARVARAARAPDGRRHLERLGALLVLLLCAQATETSWLSSFWVLFGLALAAVRPARPPRADARTRVLFVHPSDELYGSDRVLLEVLRRLDRARFVPSVLVSTDVPYAGRLTRRLSRLGVPVRGLRIGVLRRRALSSPRRATRYALDTLVSTLRIARVVRREGIHVVHANTLTVLPAALAARLSGRRLLWHVHEIVTDRPARALLHPLVRALAHRVVVVSEAARRSLGAFGASAEVVLNGVECPERVERPSSPPVVAYIGRLSGWKGPRVLLRAAARVAAKHPDARFVFAGDEFGGGGGFRTDMLAEAKRLGLEGRLELRPFLEDVSGLMAEATVVVSPSVLPEPFGLVLLEAMASGRAVIASDDGGPREIVVDGETGLLVPPGDVDALAAALDRVLSDPAFAERLGAAGRRRARERFSIESTVARLSELYEELSAAALPSSRPAPRGRTPAS